jgi:hypothetical protein
MGGPRAQVDVSTTVRAVVTKRDLLIASALSAIGLRSTMRVLDPPKLVVVRTRRPVARRLPGGETATAGSATSGLGLGTASLLSDYHKGPRSTHIARR